MRTEKIKLSVELRHLRYVVAAAEHGSFRRAAKAMKVHESAISRRIRDLEDEIGAALFIRHHGGVHLTHAGQRFLIRARRALSQIGHAAVDAASSGRGEAGVVRIGIFSSLASGFLADLLRAYVAANPSIRPDLVRVGQPAISPPFNATTWILPSSLESRSPMAAICFTSGMNASLRRCPAMTN